MIRQVTKECGATNDPSQSPQQRLHASLSPLRASGVNEKMFLKRKKKSNNELKLIYFEYFHIIVIIVY